MRAWMILFAISLFLCAACSSEKNTDSPAIDKDTLNIRGVALGSSPDELTPPPKKQQQREVTAWIYRTLELTVFDKEKRILSIEGDMLHKGDELLLQRGDPESKALKLLGKPDVKQSGSRATYFYHDRELRLQIQNGKVAKVILWTKDMPMKTKSPYKNCRSQLVKALTACRQKMDGRKMLDRVPRGEAQWVQVSELQKILRKYDCPAAGRATYSVTSEEGGGWVPEYDYIIYCSGEHHSSDGIPRDYPRAHCVEGVIAPGKGKKK